MRKIAILSSGSGESTVRLVSLFNEGNRLRVEVVLTDRENSQVVDNLEGFDVETRFFPREVWHESAGEILTFLREKGVEFVALDDFRGVLPEEIGEEFKGRIITLTGSEVAPREVVGVIDAFDLQNKTDNVSSESVSDDIPKTVDEEWAEKLHINFDKTRLRVTPPPVPDSVHQSQSDPIGNINSQDHSYQRGVDTHSENEVEPMPSNHMAIAVIMAIFCCTIPAIVALVFASQVTNKYVMGDIEGAKRSSRNAEIWIIVSFVLGVLSSTLWLPIMLVN